MERSQPDRERRARSEPRAGRQIAVMMDSSLFVVSVREDGADGWMLDLVHVAHVLDDRVDDPEAVVEERRQLANVDVAELIDGRGQNRAAAHVPAL
jgi:hypothetical protein